MYCTYCGHPNPEGSKYCEDCGKLIDEQLSVPSATQVNGNHTGWIKRLTAIGGVIVILCFFLPWVLVSCTALGINTGIKASGYEIATGNYSLSKQVNQLNQLGGLFGSSYGIDTTSAYGFTAYPALVLIPLLGAIGIYSLSGRRSGSVLAVITGVLGVLAMILFTIIVNNKVGSQINSYGMGVFHFTYQIGYWGSWIGFLWLLITGMVSLRQQN
jgi:hypothetical protein